MTGQNSLSQLQQKVYNEQDNVRIVYDENVEDHSTCAVYFSSHAVFFPDTAEEFTKRILLQDHYEWMHTRYPAYKHIFVRDIYKSWYITGISSKVQDMDSLIAFLQEETAGYHNVCMIGSSAGGYAAALVGCQLHADLIMVFDAQFNLDEECAKSSELHHPQLFHECHREDGGRYLHLHDYLNSNNILYVCSVKNPMDSTQLAYVSDLPNLHILKVKSKSHGIPFQHAALRKMMLMKKEELWRLTNKTYTSFGFSSMMIGPYKTLREMIKHRLKALI